MRGKSCSRGSASFSDFPWEKVGSPAFFCRVSKVESNGEDRWEDGGRSR